MIAIQRAGRQVTLMISTLSMGVWIINGPMAIAGEHTCTARIKGNQPCRDCGRMHHAVAGGSGGTVGYGPPGVHPGFQGFGLGYHPGYGFGGDGLGVGAEGGYPFYGGPGYPHASPRLVRLKKIVPFPHFAGPGHPDPQHPNYYAPFGPLAPDKPVVSIRDEGPDLNGYGPFTGSLPDPEPRFAPFAAQSARGSATEPRRSSAPRSTRSPDSEAREP